jgi:hypothetical protein
MDSDIYSRNHQYDPFAGECLCIKTYGPIERSNVKKLLFVCSHFAVSSLDTILRGVKGF